MHGRHKGDGYELKKIDTNIEGAYILEPKIFGDHRGYFMETYSQSVFEVLGLPSVFVQDNESFTSQKGTLRGIHFQKDPMAQSKIVRVSRGAVMDLTIDLRKGSPTYFKWQLVELSDENKRMLYIPRGCGHGFLSLTTDVQFCYKVDAPYSKEHDRTIRFDDPALGVEWGIENPILSEKDLRAPLYQDSDCNFAWHG